MYLTRVNPHFKIGFLGIYKHIFGQISGVQKKFFRDLRAHKTVTIHWNIFKLGTFGTNNDFREHVKFRCSNPSSFKENVQDVTHVRFKSYHKRQIPLYLPS